LEGTLEEGRGSFTVGSSMVGEVPVTWSSRTSPEELMAAAHASCYAMALSLVLAERGTPPENIGVQAACTLDAVSEGFRITTMDLEVRGSVPNLDEDGFRRAAERARDLPRLQRPQGQRPDQGEHHAGRLVPDPPG
jgi:osmotically inducible protein OsmC